MSEGQWDKLTIENRIEILEQKILQYEASLWDATLEINVALAAEDDASIKTQGERRTMLERGLAGLRRLRRELDSDSSADVVLMERSG